VGAKFQDAGPALASSVPPPLGRTIGWPVRPPFSAKALRRLGSENVKGAIEAT